jgi:Cation efflux family
VLVVALVGVGVNLVATLTLARANRQSLNVEGSFQHILTDLYAFIGTAVAGIVILTTGFVRADAIASLVVAALMLRSAYGLLRTPAGCSWSRAAWAGSEHDRQTARRAARRDRGPRPARPPTPSSTITLGDGYGSPAQASSHSANRRVAARCSGPQGRFRPTSGFHARCRKRSRLDPGRGNLRGGGRDRCPMRFTGALAWLHRKRTRWIVVAAVAASLLIAGLALLSADAPASGPFPAPAEASGGSRTVAIPIYSARLPRLAPGRYSIIAATRDGDDLLGDWTDIVMAPTRAGPG